MQLLSLMIRELGEKAFSPGFAVIRNADRQVGIVSKVTDKPSVRFKVYIKWADGTAESMEPCTLTYQPLDLWTNEQVELYREYLRNLQRRIQNDTSTLPIQEN